MQRWCGRSRQPESSSVQIARTRRSLAKETALHMQLNRIDTRQLYRHRGASHLPPPDRVPRVLAINQLRTANIEGGCAAAGVDVGRLYKCGISSVAARGQVAHPGRLCRNERRPLPLLGECEAVRELRKRCGAGQSARRRRRCGAAGVEGDVHSGREPVGPSFCNRRGAKRSGESGALFNQDNAAAADTAIDFRCQW